MEFGTSAPAESIPTLTLQLDPFEAALLLSDMKPSLTTTNVYDALHAKLEHFVQLHG